LKRIKREGIGLGFRGKRGKQGGFGKNAIPFLPFGSEQRIGRGAVAALEGRAPAALAAAAAGE
jgi:hypothetical protein